MSRDRNVTGWARREGDHGRGGTHETHWQHEHFRLAPLMVDDRGLEPVAARRCIRAGGVCVNARRCCWWGGGLLRAVRRDGVS